MRLRTSLAAAAVVSAVLLDGAALGAGGARPSFTPCPPVKPAVRPGQIVIACGDANFYLDGLKWTRWTKTGAHATGTGHVNDCKPYCAAGHFHTYPMTIDLTRPRTCARGQREFTRFTYRFVAAKPATIPRAATMRSGGAGCP